MSQTVSFKIVRGQVTFVDTKRMVLDILPDTSFQTGVIKDVIIPTVQDSGHGDVHFPQEGDRVSIRVWPSGTAEFVKLEALYPSQPSDSEGADFSQATTRNARIKNRRYMPGDRFFFGASGTFLELLRGGLTRIGASPMAQMIFGRVENFVKLVSQNLMVMSSAFSFDSRNSDGETKFVAAFFKDDKKGKNLSSDMHSQADFAITHDINGLTIQGREDGEETIVFHIRHDGRIAIDQKERCHIEFNPDGGMRHVVKDEEGQEVYKKSISIALGGVKVSEFIRGDYSCMATGSAIVVGEKRITLNSGELGVIELESGLSINQKTNFYSEDIGVKK